MTTAAKPVHLRAPMLIPPVVFLDATADLPQRAVGALVIVAAWWWPEGKLPEGADLGACLGIRRSRAEALLPLLLPFFAPGGTFGILRGAALAKSSRRAKAGRKGAAALHGRKHARSAPVRART